jgi:hypothetical protein
MCRPCTVQNRQPPARARKGESKTLPSFVDNEEKSFPTKFSRSTQTWKDDRDDMLEVMLRGNEVIALSTISSQVTFHKKPPRLFGR